MGSISAVGSQIPIPASANLVNQDSSNPVSNVNAQQGLSEANNAGSAASNATETGESILKGVIGNLGPTTRA
ncbi:MAG: hypothetical protein WCO92_03845 [Verrucomicrobiota bacterium]